MSEITISSSMITFAQKAANAFKSNPNLVSFSNDDIEDGEFIAVYWEKLYGKMLVCKMSEPVIFEGMVTATKDEDNSN